VICRGVEETKGKEMLDLKDHSTSVSSLSPHTRRSDSPSQERPRQNSGANFHSTGRTWCRKDEQSHRPHEVNDFFFFFFFFLLVKRRIVCSRFHVAAGPAHECKFWKACFSRLSHLFGPSFGISLE